jgi:hypothetical protein
MIKAEVEFVIGQLLLCLLGGLTCRTTMLMSNIKRTTDHQTRWIIVSFGILELNHSKNGIVKTYIDADDTKQNAFILMGLYEDH